MSQPLLTVENLKKYFPVKRGMLSKTVSWIKAVDGVSFSIDEGKTLGLVGESGCGKTTLARAVTRLLDVEQGSILFAKHDIRNIPSRKLRALRKDLQIIFQDPFNSLDPRFNVARIIQEGLSNFISKKEQKNILPTLKNILTLVGLPEDSLWRYPHEFSAGQRQRISIARSLVLRPRLLVLDEPVSSLDVSIQAQIINLILELQQEFKLTYLFISHDLHVVRAVSDTICVMHQGKIVEEGPVDKVFNNPASSYTKLLLDAAQGDVFTSKKAA